MKSRTFKGRKPGRPTGAASGMIDRATIISIALQLTKSVALTELSIVRVARELGVAPGLIHYYVEGGRDALTTGVMNAFYRDLVEQWPAETGDWIENFEVVAHAVYRAFLRYPGVTIYFASNNRYQLAQDVLPGEVDHGLVVFEKFVRTIRQAGFDAERTGVFAHLLMMFITAYAHATVARRWPGQHREFLDSKLSMLDPSSFPNTMFVREAFLHLDAASAFAAGLRLIVQALEVERRIGSASPVKPGRAKRAGR